MKKESDPVGTSISADKEETTSQIDAFPIVGIGASAGGLAAFEAFFSGMPPDSDPGMAFVLVQHLAPDHKSIRDMLVFSEQSVIKDPPVSRLDLISCRNLLIYLDGYLQKRPIPLFHYALNPGGYLFPGTSETVSEFGDLFAALERKQRIFHRKEDFSGARHAGRFLPPTTTVDTALSQAAGKTATGRKLPLRELTTALSASPEPPLYLVILEQALEPVGSDQKAVTGKQAGKKTSKPAGEDADALIAELKRELRAKEELQSTNEELATVNAELQTKVAGLSRANNDMSNLLAGTGIATVFVDLQLRLLRFTPAATKIINLIQSDIGRPVSHIVSNLPGYESLKEDTQAVLDTLVPREADVQTSDGLWYTMRIQPYRTMDNAIEGAVLTFVYDLTIEPLHDASGTVVGITGASLDITGQQGRGRPAASQQEEAKP